MRENPTTRFVLYRGQWIAMQSNVPAEDARFIERGPFEESARWVPNQIAAAALDLLAALRAQSCPDCTASEPDADVCDACRMRRAALARANGRQPEDPERGGVLCELCDDESAICTVETERNIPASEDGPERDVPEHRAACAACAVGEEIVGAVP